MGAAPRLAVQASAAASTAGAVSCPDCGTARAPGTRFCEVCRFNFDSGTPWTVSSSAPASAPAPAPVTSSAPVVAPTTPGPDPLWRVTVAVDPALYVDADPAVPCPANEAERVFPLDLTENLIGRPSPKKGIRPEVPVRDEGVSHRHAKLVRADGGGFALLDLGSTNGTKLNGKPMQEGVPVRVADGDQITLGAWTRITVRAIGRE